MILVGEYKQEGYRQIGKRFSTAFLRRNLKPSSETADKRAKNVLE